MSNGVHVDSMRRCALALLDTSLVAGLAAGGSVISGGTTGGDDRSGVPSVQLSAPFTIAGDAAEPLSPGVMVPLDLAFTNPHDVPLSVTDIRVTVQQVLAPNADDSHPCAVRDFAVDQASGGPVVTVAARETSSLSSLGVPRAWWPYVGMLNRPVNQDGCKGAILTLAYTASGNLER